MHNPAIDGLPKYPINLFCVTYALSLVKCFSSASIDSRPICTGKCGASMRLMAPLYQVVQAQTK